MLLQREPRVVGAERDPHARSPVAEDRGGRGHRPEQRRVESMDPSRRAPTRRRGTCPGPARAGRPRPRRGGCRRSRRARSASASATRSTSDAAASAPAAAPASRRTSSFSVNVRPAASGTVARPRRGARRPSPRTRSALLDHRRPSAAGRAWASMSTSRSRAATIGPGWAPRSLPTLRAGGADRGGVGAESSLEHAAQETLGHRRAADVAGADHEDVGHGAASLAVAPARPQAPDRASRIVRSGDRALAQDRRRPVREVHHRRGRSPRPAPPHTGTRTRRRRTRRRAPHNPTASARPTGWRW